jgi:hypothetical protein
LIGENGLLKQLTKKLVERALEAEMAEHLGHARHEPIANPTGNTRNGKSKKTSRGNLASCRSKCLATKKGCISVQLLSFLFFTLRGRFAVLLNDPSYFVVELRLFCGNPALLRSK